MIDLNQLLPVPLIVAIVELFKIFGLPDKWVKVSVFILALALAGFFFWNTDYAQIAVNVLVYACSAAGLYSLGIKPVKTLLK